MNMNRVSRMHDNPFLRHCHEERQYAHSLKVDREQNITQAGMLKDALDFVVKEQLLDRKLWAKFVEQFRLKSDTSKQEWRIEYWGKMMRGAVFVYTVTRDVELYRVMEETVRDLLTTQDDDGAFTTYASNIQFSKWDIWGRKYVLMGLLCFHGICTDDALCEQVITAAKRHADAILMHVGDSAEGKVPIEETSIVASGHLVHGAMNALSVLEPIVLLYRATGEKRYLNFAEYLVEIGAKGCGNIFELAYANRLAPYQYPYTKAYEMMSCFEGLLEYALTVGSEKWKQAAIRFAYRMMESDVTILGSAGTTHEFLDHASVHQTDPNDAGIGQETCVSVTWMKLCARMLVVTGDPIFADCIEQTLYNAYLGTLNVHHVSDPSKFPSGFVIPGITPKASFLPFDSYTPHMTGLRGQTIGGALLFGDGSYYGCCACIGAVGIGLAPHLALMKTDKGFSVQLFANGKYQTKTPNGNNVSFSIKTNYPVDSRVRIDVDVEEEENFELSLRIPSWSLENSLQINGTDIEVSKGNTVIDRTWHAGDVIELQLDMRLEALRPTPYGKDFLRSKIIWKTCEMVPFVMEETPEHMRYVAFRRGPLVLAKNESSAQSTKNELKLPTDSDVYLVEKAEHAENTLCAVTVLQDGKKMLELIDCMSAGRTWNDGSKFSVWMKVSN